MLANLVIRLATEEDLTAIIDLASDAVRYSVSPFRDLPPETVRQFRHQDLQTLRQVYHKPEVGVFVAETSEGEFLGHVIIFGSNQDSSTGETQAWVIDLSVHEAHWGKGIGKALMEQAERYAADLGMARIGLGVTSSNRRAVDFYLGLGYREERIQMIKKL